MVDDSPGIWPKWQNTPYKQLWVGYGSVFRAHLVQCSQWKETVMSESAINPKGICIGCQIHTNPVATGHSNFKKPVNRWDTFNKLQFKTFLQMHYVWFQLFRCRTSRLALERSHRRVGPDSAWDSGQNPYKKVFDSHRSPHLLHSSVLAGLMAPVSPAFSFVYMWHHKGRSLTSDSRVGNKDTVLFPPHNEEFLTVWEERESQIWRSPPLIPLSVI